MVEDRENYIQFELRGKLLPEDYIKLSHYVGSLIIDANEGQIALNVDKTATAVAQGFTEKTQNEQEKLSLEYFKFLVIGLNAHTGKTIYTTEENFKRFCQQFMQNREYSFSTEKYVYGRVWGELNRHMIYNHWGNLWPWMKAGEVEECPCPLKGLFARLPEENAPVLLGIESVSLLELYDQLEGGNNFGIGGLGPRRKEYLEAYTKKLRSQELL